MSALALIRSSAICKKPRAHAWASGVSSTCPTMISFVTACVVNIHTVPTITQYLISSHTRMALTLAFFCSSSSVISRLLAETAANSGVVPLLSDLLTFISFCSKRYLTMFHRETLHALSSAVLLSYFGNQSIKKILASKLLN